jgi:hypothetical protein
MDEHPDIQFGAGVLGLVWETVAKKVIDLAIEIYNATPEQAAAIKLLFLASGTYQIEIY